MQFQMGELFCGPGGLALAATTTRCCGQILHKWATDYDGYACATYRENICPQTSQSVICTDVRKLNFSSLPDIDALSFGFPCNDFSMVGEQKGVHGKFGPLYKYGVTALNTFNPKWFLAENVGGLRSANAGFAFQRILNELKSASHYGGYNITAHLYKFEEYGVPQCRHRIIIVGIRRDLQLEFKVPAPTVKHPKTAREALEQPPIPPDAFNHEMTLQSKTVIDRLQYIKPGENAFTAQIPPELQLKVRGATISQIYKRLDPDKPAYTVTGSGGGGTHMYHWAEPRALTNRERARLQTFPDDYRFMGAKESVRKQIGMAVPPEGARVIFEAILKTFSNEKYNFIPSNFHLEFYSL